MRAFDHHTPTSLPQALALLARLDGQAQVNAGGTDLMLKLKSGLTTPAALVNIKRLPELKGITFITETGLQLGALTTLRELTRSPLIKEFYPCLALAASVMASEQIRTFATLGGNLCNASPSADMAPPLIALDAVAHIAGPDGERQLPLEKFFLGPGQSALAPGELLRRIEVPPPRGETRYIKHSSRAYMDIAIVGLGLRLELVEGVCQTARIVLGAVAPTPLRVQPAEDALTGYQLNQDRIDQAARIAAETASPIDDVRGSAWYRRRMVEVLTRRTLLDFGF